MSAPRVALLAVSLAAAGWFGVSAREAHDEQGAESLVSRLSGLTPAQIGHARDLLDGASVLDPDSHVDVLRAELALHQRRVGEARRILDGVLAREPKAIEAWALEADALRRSDPPAARRARAQVLHLAPPVPRP